MSADIPFLSRVKFLDKLLFTKHLATMIKAGVPITEGLGSLVDSAQRGTFKRVLAGVAKGIEAGQTFAKSLSKYPKVFDDFYISLVRVGEESGTLEENLEYLATQLSKDYSLRKKIRGAMFYPAIIFSATIIMGGFISIFVLPKLVDFFEGLEVELPLATRALLFFANVMKNYGIFIIAGFFAAFFAISLLLRIPVVKARWHRLIIKIPLIGKFLIYGQLVRFTRNLGILIKSGIPVTKALQTTADTLSNIKFKHDLYEVSKVLAKGKNISTALSQKKYSEFPPIVTKMIAVGERTGKIDETLLYLADFYDDEIDDMSKTLPQTIEPILLITIGLAVGFVAIAIITPIYEITGSIGR